MTFRKQAKERPAKLYTVFYVTVFNIYSLFEFGLQYKQLWFGFSLLHSIFEGTNGILS